jgi:hypothetical protein
MHQVKRGSLLIYRQFDVADGIRLDDAQKRVQRGETQRLDLRRVPKASISIATPPLSFGLGQHRLQIEREEHAVDASVRVYDFGVVSIQLKIEIPDGTGIDALAAWNALLSGSQTVDRLAKDLALQVSEELNSVMLRPKFSGFVEDYSLAFVEKFSETPALPLLKAEMGRFLLQDTSPRRISQDALDDATAMSFSYYEDELAVVDYNSAFVYDPHGDQDIADLIEFASAQLLEMRYYDAALDREVGSLYERVNRSRGGSSRTLARSLLRVVLEVTDLTERIENSLKWVGDPYLAKVYQAALSQFQMQRWQQQVEGKLRLMMEVVDLLNNQNNTDRSFLLEAMIFFLIAIEVVMAFWR